MGWKSARASRRWAAAWRPGGIGVKVTAGVFALLVVPPCFLWFGRDFIAPWAYYPVGLSLEMSAVLIAFCLALPFAIVMARARFGSPTALDGETSTAVIIFLVSLFMAFGGAMGALTFLNGALDSSPPETRTVAVLARSPWTKVYLRYFRVTSWRAGERDERDVKVWVELDLYRKFPDRVAVTTRRGALGFEWVVSVSEPAGVLDERADCKAECDGSISNSDSLR